MDFYPEHEAKLLVENADLIENHTSQINKDAGLPEKIDFWKFTASIKDTIQNDYSKVNNGEASISVDWMLSCCFITLTQLKDVAHFNQEDLPFKEADGCYYGRSVMALIIQEFYAQHQEVMLRNFEILTPLNNPVLAEATIHHLEKQRDISLKREEARKHLGTLKCQKTGKTGLAILDPDFTVLK